jgi:N-acyl-D-aspartate/D-glutamate deacylase
MLRRVIEQSGRPMSMTLLQKENRPDDWLAVLEAVNDSQSAGFDMSAQVMGKATNVMLGFELSLSPFIGRPSYEALKPLPFPTKIQALRDPELRRRILAEASTDQDRVGLVTAWRRIFPLGDPPVCEPPPSASLQARAEREGRTPDEIAYDLMLAEDGRGLLLRLVSNYGPGDLSVVQSMLTAPHTLVGLGDGGAHLGLLCDSSNPTHLLSYWTRDRNGHRFPLEWAVKRLTSEPAAALGLHDRGRLAVGAKADINVIDYDRLALKKPEVLYDLPAGGRRVVQRADGYDATIVAGRIVHEHGSATGNLPGRLLRAGTKIAT